jgi:DNA repair photolyase
MKKVNNFIQRKSLIYKTNVEYGDYTINHIQGCSHGCKYPCYAYMMKKRFGKIKTYEDWIKPAIVENTLELLDLEIPKFKDKITTLHLCFTTDPFMYGYDDIKALSLSVIRKLNDAGIKCSVLTKGLLPIELKEYSKDNEYGITLVSLNEDYRKRIEPGAAPYKQRLSSLRALHDAGFKTWVSIEPYPTPNIIEQNLDDILEAISFTDKIIFGRTNYSKEITAFKQHKEFYNEQAEIVIKFCKSKNIDYLIKDGTITKA